ncbi:hypothetical protein FACS1894137_12460 [Spirochaetia bacterium]|nr:hypothetical protein FACS1894137_12460 [Spirochaetia bacterium]
MENYEEIRDNKTVIAIILRNDYSEKGMTFFTPENSVQQLAFMNRKKNTFVENHIHNPVKREITGTQEFIFVKHGKMKTDFYTQNKEYICSRVLQDGDAVLQVSGGHGFEMLEEVDLIVLKQGPYAGESDKTHF